MTEPAIEARHLSKKFARSMKRVMAYGLIDILKIAAVPHWFRSEDHISRLQDTEKSVGEGTRSAFGHRLRPQEFWALQDISFSLRRGECVGIIGHNGAGKSTLFKVLSGILAPTCGSVTVRGRLSALIEVGSGFHPMLSGRENIYISGAVLGMSENEIRKKFDDIVAFSGVEEFIDMPIKFYSSGMHVRLGFSVLAHLEPEVMLIDEILAVGDVNFQAKCIERINELRARDMAIALVSHSMHRIESLSDRVFWFDCGKICMEGDPADVLAAYRDFEIRQEDSPYRTEGGRASLAESDYIAVNQAEVVDLSGQACKDLAYGQPFKIRVAFRAKTRIENPMFSLAVESMGARVFEASMFVDGKSPEYIDGPGVLDCLIPEPTLLPRKYHVFLFVRDKDACADLVPITDVVTFNVTGEGLQALAGTGPFARSRLLWGSLVYLNYQWDQSQITQSGESAATL